MKYSLVILLLISFTRLTYANTHTSNWNIVIWNNLDQTISSSVVGTHYWTDPDCSSNNKKLLTPHSTLNVCSIPLWYGHDSWEDGEIYLNLDDGYQIADIHYALHLARTDFAKIQPFEIRQQDPSFRLKIFSSGSVDQSCTFLFNGSCNRTWLIIIGDAPHELH